MNAWILFALAAAAGVLIVSIWIIQLAAYLLQKYSHEMKTWQIVICTVFVWIMFCAGGVFLFLNQTVKAEENAAEGLISEERVVVHQVESGWYFDGWAGGQAAVFFGKRGVEESAYAPLLKEIARQGLDCWLVTYPYSIADFDPELPDAILNSQPGTAWFLMAHGDGIFAADAYYRLHSDEVQGMILLGCSPLSKMQEDDELILIQGDHDELMDNAAYNSSSDFLPEHVRETVLTGGNHSGFAACGLLKGDAEAKISPSLQRQKTSELICNAFIHFYAGD